VFHCHIICYCLNISKIVLLELLETTTLSSQKVLNITCSISCRFTCYVGHVGSDIVVTEECIIGASCSVDGTESLPRRTIICGSNNQRYTLAQPPSVSQYILQEFTSEFPSKIINC